MQTVIVTGQQSGKRIDRILMECFPHMPVSAMYKAFRKKDVRVNGLRAKETYVANTGDKIEIYLIDDILHGIPSKGDSEHKNGYSIVYEDDNIIIVDKEQGLPVHPDREQATGTLIDLVISYIKEKGTNISNNSSFTPSLCHRLDRNTGGLVMIAKNETSLNILLEKIRNREIRKYYQCIVKGKMEKSQAELKAYLFKDESKSRVFINKIKTRGSLEIVTKYKVLSFDAATGTSKLEIELVTGRTHQIRAHLAYVGHPIVGDGKYGINTFNRSLGVKYQALWAYKIIFDFNDYAGILQYLKGKVFQVEPRFRLKMSK